MDLLKQTSKDTDNAVLLFEKLTENFVYFISSKNLENDIKNIKINFEVSYFLNNDLTKEFKIITYNNTTYNITKKDVLENNILDNIIKIRFVFNQNINILNKTDRKEYEANFNSSPYFIVNYNEFVSKLANLGYEVKYDNFNSLKNFSLNSTKSIPKLINIDLIPTKYLKK